MWKKAKSSGITFPSKVLLVETKTRKKKRVYYRNEKEMQADIRLRNRKERGNV